LSGVTIAGEATILAGATESNLLKVAVVKDPAVRGQLTVQFPEGVRFVRMIFESSDRIVIGASCFLSPGGYLFRRVDVPDIVEAFTREELSEVSDLARHAKVDPKVPSYQQPLTLPQNSTRCAKK
jgi:hypothetical protein